MKKRKGIKHGTLSTYCNRACRCERCKRAKRCYDRSRRQRRDRRQPMPMPQFPLSVFRKKNPDGSYGTAHYPIDEISEEFPSGFSDED